MRPPRRDQLRAAARPSRCSGPSRILAKIRSNGARARNRGVADAVGSHDLDQAAGAVEPRIGARDAHGARHRCRSPARAAAARGRRRWRARRCRCRDRECAGASRCAFEPALAQPVEREQAAARGAVMAGAEGERRLDLDADAVGRHAGAVMRAVHDEAAGRDRRQSGEALPNPVRRFDAPEAQSRGRRGSGRRLHRRPHRVSVGRRAEMDRDAPASAAGIHKLTATSSAAKLSATTSPTPCAARSSVSSRATKDGTFTALAEDIDGTFAFFLIPEIHTNRRKSRRGRNAADYSPDDTRLIHKLSRIASTAFPPTGHHQMADRRVLRELHFRLQIRIRHRIFKNLL